MKKFIPLFLFTFIILHSITTGKPVFLKTDHIASVFDSIRGTSVWTVGQIDPFVVKESFDEVTNKIINNSN